MTNQLMQTYYPTFEMYQALRQQLMEILSDDDLAFRLDGNPVLGELCREMGEVEQAYIDSFKTGTLDFGYQHPEATTLEENVAGLVAWYGVLDAELKETVAALSDEDIANTLIDRGAFKLPPNINLFIYNEAQLIFYGKVTVYLRAMGKALPEQWQDWIG
ncbi:MAG: hypothetical protein AAF614_31415 [Chloroflexota bacterium]